MASDPRNSCGGHRPFSLGGPDRKPALRIRGGLKSAFSLLGSHPVIGLCCSNWMAAGMTNQRVRGSSLRFDPGHLRNSEKKPDVSNLQAGFCGFCGYIYLCFFQKQ